jgi:hypothetical protein
MSATTDSVIDGASMVLLLETFIDDSKLMLKTQDEKMAWPKLCTYILSAVAPEQLTNEPQFQEG